MNEWMDKLFASQMLLIGGSNKYLDQVLHVITVRRSSKCLYRKTHKNTANYESVCLTASWC